MMTDLICPRCGRTIVVIERREEQTVECEHCGYVMEVLNGPEIR